MEAVYTTSGMYIKPYHKKLDIILLSRSVWVQGSHGKKPVTAYRVKDNINGGSWLLTYRCGKSWLQSTYPDIVISNLPRNKRLRIDEKFKLNDDVVPTDIQMSATQAVIENDMRSAFFNIPTGYGKTLLAAFLMSLLDTKAWCMCYSTTVLDQWKKTLEEMTTMDASRIKYVKSGSDLAKMAAGDWDPHKYDIYLSTPKILSMWAERNGLDKLNDVFDTCGIGVKFFDEAHRNLANIVKINALTNVERTFYMSADFGQASQDREALYYKMFQYTPVIKPLENITRDMRYTIGVLVRYNTHPSLNDIESVFGGYGFSHHRFMEYQLSRDNFFVALFSVFDAIRRSDEKHHAEHPDAPRYKTLVLCNLIDHVDLIKEQLELYYQERTSEGETPPKVVRFHSAMPHEEREDARANGEIIVSTYQSMGVGVDIKNIKNVISLSPVNNIEANQAAGRARALADGTDAYYYMFVDDGFDYVKRSLPYRLQYLEQQKIKSIFSIKYS